MSVSSRSRRWSSRETRAGSRERERRPHRHRRRARARRVVPRGRSGGRAQTRSSDVSCAPGGGARADRGRAQGARGGGSTGRGQARTGTEGQVAEEHGVPGPAAAGDGQHQARGSPAHDAQRGAAPGREAVDRQRRRHGEYGRGGVPVPRVLAEHRRSGATGLAAPAPEHAPRGGGLVPGTSRRVGERSPAPQALGELCVRPRSAGGRRAGGAHQGVPRAPGRLGCRRPVRPVLLRREAPVRRLLFGLAVLSVGAPVRLTAQDTSATDRGVRIGIIYRPGVRPGMVLLPVHAPGLDSVRAIMTRDLDYSDRFELIRLPGADGVRGRAAAPGARPPAAGGTGRGTGGGGAAAATTLNYPLYQALGADFAVAVLPASGDSTIVTVHDVAAGGVRRELRVHLPALKDPAFRLAVHQLADRVLEAALGAGGTAATRVLFVMEGKVYAIDQDGADQKLVSSSDHQAMSPAWARDGRRFAYMEFWEGHGKLFVQEVASGKRAPVATTGQALDFTPAFSPDGKTLAFSRATEEGTDLYTVNIKDGCCLQRLTVGRFYDNLSPTYSPDGQRIAFVSTRPGLPQIYVMAADGTDQQLFAPFDYGATGSSNAPEWSPDGQTVAFHRDVGGTLQVFVLDVRTRAVRQLTSVGRNEDPTWAPDSRHMAFVSDRSGYRQLWIIDVETGRIRPLLQKSGARLPAWSPRLPETASSTP